MKLSGVTCLRSQQHYLTLLDDAEAMNAIRHRFRKARDINFKETPEVGDT